MIKSYTFLICAILAEALGTTTLKLSEQFTKPVPAIVTVLAYATAFVSILFSAMTILSAVFQPIK